ncbi:MAG: YciI family protein [Thermoanaerobaculaceae bacterium]|jgi:hypothetical protein|nr:YciI family protein [Thermoanaerobaculaceae bacterium]
MHFLILGHDGTDPNAPQRRLAVRAAHLALFKEMVEKGVFLYGSAILNDDGQMVGSMIVGDFPSRADLESQWLVHEPYVVGEVWKKVEIHRAQVPPLLLAVDTP